MSLLDSGRSVYTVRIYTAAISACHEGLRGTGVLASSPSLEEDRKLNFLFIDLLYATHIFGVQVRLIAHLI